MLKILNRRRAQRVPSTTVPTQQIAETTLMELSNRLRDTPVPSQDLSDTLFELPIEGQKQALRDAMIGTLFICRNKGIEDETVLAAFIYSARMQFPIDMLLSFDIFVIGAEALLEYRRLCSV